MESPALYTPQQSKKSVFPGSSSSCMDPDVVEISPPTNWSSNSKLKRKQVIPHEVINIEDDPDGIVIIDNEPDFSYKGKQSANMSYNNTTTSKATGRFFGSGFSGHDFVSDDAFMDLFKDGSVFDDNYSFLQGKFDNIGIPTNIEAPVHSFIDLEMNEKKAGHVSSSNYHFSHAQLNAEGKSRLFSSSSSWQTQSKFSTSNINNKKSKSPVIPHNWSSNINICASKSLSKLHSNPPVSSSIKKKTLGLGASKTIPSQMAAQMAAQMGSFPFPPSPFAGGQIFQGLFNGGNLGINGQVHPAVGSTQLLGSPFSPKKLGNYDEIMEKFQIFKQFDTVEDYSDHHYAIKGSSETQQPNQWAKRIQKEWKILENDLPDTILVRVYESRMDLLRAVIVGAQGTPYHDGLFFFDVFFPSSYPSVPPHVYYHSGGLRINPNLYNCGKVCLSLLNTWSGSGNEKWIKNKSTMLQVLVSIQALILNEKPYFNEPGFAGSAESVAGELSSQNYSENTFILSLKTMVYTMRKPPKQFEEFVVGHFCTHAQDILGACKIYIEEGIEAGSVTKGEARSVQRTVKKCSSNFKVNVASHISMLVQAFIQIGAKDCNKFLSLAQTAAGQIPSSLPPTYNY